MPSPASGSSLIIALYIPGINVVFQLMGSTTSALVCFVLPAALAMKLQIPEVKGAVGKAGCMLLFAGGIGISIVATGVTILQLTGES